ncbi:MAG TPA: hypothetical protein VMW68_02320 [Methyloceanibacter sp.]|nr:hypothetical protein [Methyloceanibacter sp.]
MLAINPLAAGQGALGRLAGEQEGFAVDAKAPHGTVTVRHSTTPANNLLNVPLDDGNVIQEGTSPKLVLWSDGLYRWTPHNLFLNAATPATQNVTLITGETYTVEVTGAGGGNITGSVGASGSATTGSPATFVATGTSGTFTLTGSLDTIQINRGSVATKYLETGGSRRIGIPQEYDAAEGVFAIRSETQATNVAFPSRDFSSWSSTNVALASGVTAPDGTPTAYALTENNGGASYGRIFKATSGGAIPASTGFVSSVFLKAPIAFTASLRVRYNGVQLEVLNINVTTEWQRFEVPVTSGAVSGTAELHVFLNPDSLSGIADAGRVIHVWQAQIERGDVATSPIPTFTATVARTEDLPIFQTSTYPHDMEQGMWIIEFKRLLRVGVF